MRCCCCCCDQLFRLGENKCNSYESHESWECCYSICICAPVSARARGICVSISPYPLYSLYLRIENRLRDCGMQPLDGQAKPSQARPEQSEPAVATKNSKSEERTEKTRADSKPLNVVKQSVYRLYASYIGLWMLYTTIYYEYTIRYYIYIYTYIYVSIDLLWLNKRFTFLWRQVVSSWRCGVANVERGVAGRWGKAEDRRQCKIS